MSREAKILTAILVVVAGGMIGLFVLANGGGSSSSPTPQGDKTKIIRDNSHKHGSGSVQFVEFGDFECPACAKAQSTVTQLQKDYDGRVTFYFRNFPLTEIHKNAMASAEAAESAGDQGKYWEMHDKLYETQDQWVDEADPSDKLAGIAASLGLDGNKVKDAIKNNQFESFIKQDRADGDALGINATPTFFVNGKQVQKVDYPTLRDAIEAALKGQ